MESKRAEPPPVPEVPGYKLIRQVGQGRFGSVWLAEAISTDGGVLRYTAVKLLRVQDLADHEVAAIRALLNRLPRGHPNLVGVLQVGETGGQVFYAMDLADGYAETGTPVVPTSYEPRTLEAEIRRRGFQGLERAIGVLREALAGLDHLHSHGLLHRDVKPANIVFLKGVAALSDLGLVTSLKDAHSNAGTPLYSPPEGTRDASGDLYALGKVLFEMITGTPPARFPELPPELSEAQLAAVRRLRPVIDRACDPDPERRFRTAGEFSQALDAVQTGGKSSWQRRAGWAVVILGLLALLAAAIFLWVPHKTSIEGMIAIDWLQEDGNIQGSLVELDPGLHTGDRFRIGFTLEPPSYPLVAAVFRNEGEPENTIQIRHPKEIEGQKAVNRLTYPVVVRDAIPLDSPPATVLILALASSGAITPDDKHRVEGLLRSLPPLPRVDRVRYLKPHPARTQERGPGAEIRSNPAIFETVLRLFAGEIRLVDAVAFQQLDKEPTR